MAEDGHKAEWIEYPHPELGVLAIERLADVSFKDTIGAHVLRLLTASYQSEFEEKTDLVSSGTVFDTFRPNNFFHQIRFANRMRTFIGEHKSQYWLAHLEQPTGRLPITGLVKLSPLRASTRPSARPNEQLTFGGNAYLNDILVDPSYQGRGIGNALLHAALSYNASDYSTLTLDAYTGSDAVNDWYRKLGLTPTDGWSSYSFRNHASIQLMRYSSDPKTLGDIAADLESRRPWLAQAESF